jgi:diguanylate cyclase (GGDEF)-like protein/PAS domain S-box-containing protein
MPLFKKNLATTGELYRLILDNALDAFIAIDASGRVIHWSLAAERTFGWTSGEAVGSLLTDNIVPPRYREAHRNGLERYLKTGEQRRLERRIEIQALRKDGVEIPVELSITPIGRGDELIFSAAARDISRGRALENEARRQASITTSVLDSMADAVAVADRAGNLLMINPAGRRLLNMPASRTSSGQTFRDYDLLHEDGVTRFSDGERPMARALRGESLSDVVGRVSHEGDPPGPWISANGRPLLDSSGELAGGVVVFHDITGQREREAMLTAQALALREQASLLDLTRDAVLARNLDDLITYWNGGAERLYGYSAKEAVGRRSNDLLRTTFSTPSAQIMQALATDKYWAGQLVHMTKSGKEVIVFSQWAAEMRGGEAYRYLETNTDITDRVKTERVLRQTQESYRLLVEKSTDFAIITTDVLGSIQTWNAGAENIMGLTDEEAVGHHISEIFTPEDRTTDLPKHELDNARLHGRAEDNRWHLKRDGSRFWASGVVMPLWNDDGRLRGFVKIMRDQTSQRLAEEQTHFFANHDMLTGLPNRVYFSNELHKSIVASRRSHTPLSVLLLDLDRFKTVNDTFGHHTGDLLLKEVAMRIRSTLRENDFVARLGGDEFVVIQVDVTQPRAAETLAGKLVEKLGQPYQLEGSEIVTGASVGVSTCPFDGGDVVDLLKKADLALYRAKSHGRGTWRFYQHPPTGDAGWAAEREDALRHALANNELLLYYQPQIDLDTWKISSVEALLRWKMHDVDMVLPNDFLAMAEESGIIVEIGEWALAEACRQVKRWQDRGMNGLRIAVNCSAQQFTSDFVERMTPILRAARLPDNSLELEVRESMLTSVTGIKPQLRALRALGVRITIDNYGTGTNPLIDLRDFEVDGLKIDRAFVEHLPHRRKDSAIASAIISLAQSLGIDVSAGGVETAEQLAYLKARACTSAQGYIFSAPLPADELETLMMEGHWSRMNDARKSEVGPGFRSLH